MYLVAFIGTCSILIFVLLLVFEIDVFNGLQLLMSIFAIQKILLLLKIHI